MTQAVTVHEGASSSWYSYLVAQRWPEAFFQTPPIFSKGVPMSHFVFRLLVGQTKDGQWLQFAQNRPRLFEAFLRSLGLGWMLTDPKWKGIPILEDDDLRLELWERMLGAVRERSLDEWQEVFAGDRDVYGERYRRGPEVLEHPQLVHERFVVDVDDPERGPVRQPGPMFRMSGTPGTVEVPAPALGKGDLPAWDAVAPEPPPPGPEGRLPLAGVTVLELAMQYAAPMGVTLLPTWVRV